MLRPFDPILDAEESLLHTTDINMANSHSPVPPVQGGFLVIRPDLVVFEQLTEVSARRQRLMFGPFRWGIFPAVCSPRFPDGPDARRRWGSIASGFLRDREPDQ